MSVLIETSFGDVTVDVWTDKAPRTAVNFIKLCKMKHYNNALFIEVQKSICFLLFIQKIILLVCKHKNQPPFGNLRILKMVHKSLMIKSITS